MNQHQFTTEGRKQWTPHHTDRTQVGVTRTRVLQASNHTPHKRTPSTPPALPHSVSHPPFTIHANVWECVAGERGRGGRRARDAERPSLFLPKNIFPTCGNTQLPTPPTHTPVLPTPIHTRATHLLLWRRHRRVSSHDAPAAGRTRHPPEAPSRPSRCRGWGWSWSWTAASPCKGT